MAPLLWLAKGVVLIAVEGRCIVVKLRGLPKKPEFCIGNASTPDMLEVEGRLAWLGGCENDRAWVVGVGVLIRFLMLLMRAWLRAVESRGTLDFRNVFEVVSLHDMVDRGRDSWLALAMTSRAFAGRSGISNRVASAAGNADCVELVD
jgi:hypothetical protein